MKRGVIGECKIKADKQSNKWTGSGNNMRKEKFDEYCNGNIRKELAETPRINEFGDWGCSECEKLQRKAQTGETIVGADYCGCVM